MAVSADAPSDNSVVRSQAKDMQSPQEVQSSAPAGDNALVTQTSDLMQNAGAWRGCRKGENSSEANDSQLKCMGFPQIDLTTSETKAPERQADTVAEAGPLKDQADKTLKTLPFGDLTLTWIKVPGKDMQSVGARMERDVEPGRLSIPALTEGAKPVLLTDIAKKHLGEGATESEIRAYAFNIQDVNAERVDTGTAPFTAKPGVELILPGYSKDGSVRFVDANQTEVSYRADGSFAVKYKDGSGFVRTADKFDGKPVIKDSQFGADGAKRGEIVKDAVGNVLSDTRPIRPVGELSIERAKLIDLAKSTIHIDKERREFLQNMQKLEDRAKRESVPASQIAATFNDLARIIAPDSKSPLSQREKVRMAEGAIKAAAEPRSNDQGKYGTCQTIVAENRLYSKSPSTITGLLAQIAERGSFVTKDGTRVDMDSTNLRAHGQAALNQKPGSDTRSYSSQVLQTAIINAHLTKIGMELYPPENIKYMQGTHVLQGKNVDAVDNGEHLVAYTTNPIQKAKLSAGYAMLGEDSLVKSYAQITGQFRPDLYLIASSDPGAKSGYKSATKFGSVEELASVLSQLKEAEGKTGPIFAPIVVHANSKTILPNRSSNPLDLKPETEHIEQDGHVLNVYDYDPKTGLVKIDNQWGNKHDYIEKPLTVDQLYNATLKVTPKEWMDRLEAHKPKMKPAAFDKQLSNITESMLARYTTDLSQAQASAEMQAVINRYNALRQGRQSDVLSATDKKIDILTTVIKVVQAQ